MAHKIFSLHEKGELNLVVAHSNLKEIEHPNTPLEIKRLARSQLFSCETELNERQRLEAKIILDILAGNGDRIKMTSDANHVLEAHRHNAYFVTADERILKRRVDLKRVSRANIVKPSELIGLIEEFKATL